MGAHADDGMTGLHWKSGQLSSQGNDDVVGTTSSIASSLLGYLVKVSGVIVNPGSFHGSTAICVTGDCALVGVGKSKGSLVGNSPCGMNVVEREVLGR